MDKLFKFTKNQLNIIKERRQFLNERVSSVVYHWASPSTAYKIISGDRFSLMSSLFKKAESKLVGSSHNHLYYMSLTRNGKIGQGGYSNNDQSWVRFTLDGDMINSNFHTKALDYWGSSMGKNSRMNGSGTYNGGSKFIPKDGYETEAEDRLYSKKPFINDALKYIKHIDVYLKFDKGVIDSDVLEDIYHTYLKCSSIMSVYTSLKDFNNGVNAIDPEELSSWFQQQYEQSPKNDRIHYSRNNDYVFRQFIEFIAAAAYLVNFPAKSKESCFRTLNEYGLKKYIKQVASIYNKNRYYYSFGYEYWTPELVDRTFYEEIFPYLQIANNAQSIDRDELSKGFKILTDYCSKHKLSNYDDILSYLKQMIIGNEDAIKEYDWGATMNVTCVYLEDEPNKFYLCLDPNTDKYTEVIRNGKDYLKSLYDDFKYEVKYNTVTHKSQSNNHLLGYMRRFFNNNPSVKDVADFCDKWKNLGNSGLNTYYSPVVTTKTITFDNMYALVGSLNTVYLDDGTSVLIVADDNQKKKLAELYNTQTYNS